MADTANTIGEKGNTVLVEHHKGRESFFSSIYADIAGVLITLAAGVGAAIIFVDNAFSRNAYKDKKLIAAQEARDSARLKAPLSEYIDASKTAEAAYTATKRAIYEEMGVINNPIKKFRGLRTHQKWETGFTMAAVSAAAVGLIANFVGNRQTFLKQQELEDRLDAAEAKRNTEQRAL